jgi:dTDP-4-amino-4,6-dideoxygalactose transaminase
VQAALVLFQMDKFEKIIQARKAIAEMYVAELSKVSEIVLPTINTPSNFHKFVIQHPNRNELKKFLELNGVQTMIHYEKCLNEYSIYKTDEVFTNAKRINNSCLSLPIYYGLNSNDLHIIINLLKSFNH